MENYPGQKFIFPGPSSNKDGWITGTCVQALLDGRKKYLLDKLLVTSWSADSYGRRAQQVPLLYINKK